MRRTDKRNKGRGETTDEKCASAVDAAADQAVAEAGAALVAGAARAAWQRGEDARTPAFSACARRTDALAGL